MPLPRPNHAAGLPAYQTHGVHVLTCDSPAYLSTNCAELGPSVPGQQPRCLELPPQSTLSTCRPQLNPCHYHNPWLASCLRCSYPRCSASFSPSSILHLHPSSFLRNIVIPARKLALEAAAGKFSTTNTPSLPYHTPPQLDSHLQHCAASVARVHWLMNTLFTL